MKKEILNIRNLNLAYSNAIKLEDISLCLMEGESTSFLGLNSSGKDVLIEVICGNEWPDTGTICVDGKFMVAAEDMKAIVHRMVAINYAVTDWTVAEYIGLVTNRLPWMFYNKKLVSDMERLIGEFDLDIDAKKKLSELSELDKRLVDVVKACSKHTRILIIEDEFEGCTVGDIKKFQSIMNRIIAGRMTVIINTYSDMLNQILSDNYTVFKNGNIIIKCKKKRLKDKKDLEFHLFGEYLESKKKRCENSSRAACKQNCPEMYSVKNLVLQNGKKHDLSFASGEIVTLLSLNKKEKERIFNILSGRLPDKTARLYLENRLCNFKNLSDFVRNKIVSGAYIGTRDELLPLMSVGDNILIPSLIKISSAKYIFYGSKITKMLEREIACKIAMPDDNTGSRETIGQIALLFERWNVYNPKVVLLLEPFIQCDVHGVSLVKSYISRFTQTGAAVIIVSSREEHIEEISDCIISIG